MSDDYDSSESTEDGKRGDDSSGDSDEDLLCRAMKSFARKQEHEDENRKNWLDDYRFARLGEQWPEDVKRQRDKDGRPCLTVNRLPAFIRQVTNDARQNSPSIKFHPVGDGADQATAKILDGLTRNIEYSSNAEVAYDGALENAVTGGFGYFRVVTDYAEDDVFEQDIKIEAVINPLTIYGDETKLGADSADWDECFVTELMPRAEFKRRWPDAEVTDFQGVDDFDGKDDWINTEEVRVAEWWTREDVPATLLKLSNGEVMYQPEYEKAKEIFDIMRVSIAGQRDTTTKRVTQRIITCAEILETNDWAGKYIPIVPVYGDSVVIEGKRYLLSLVRFAKDPQRMFNYWRSASTELVALAPKTPFIGAVGQFATDAEKWANANTVSHSHIEYDPVNIDGQPAGAPQRQGFAGPPAGALQEAANASEDMKSVMGLYDASLGARSNETSGKAILARQREGDTSTYNFTDNLSRAIRHLGRILVDLIPKVYDTERMIRVIHEDGTNTSVPVNGAQPPAPPQPRTPEEAAKQQEEMQGMAAVYNITTGKYDVTCETGPSYNTKREESSEQMMAFMQAVPGAAAVMGDLVAKNLDWPGAEDIAERLKKMLPPQIQGQDPATQAAQQQLQQAQQAIGQLQQHAAALQKQLADKGAEQRTDGDKVKIDAYKAETDRIKALGLTLTPEAAAGLGMQTAQSAAQALSGPDLSGVAPGAQDMPAMLQQAMSQPQMQPPQPQPQQVSQPAPPGAPPEGFPQ